MHIDYAHFSTANASSEPSSMIVTFRAIHYSVQAAIADIIDNSISAGAKNICVDSEWKEPETWIAIKDDGFGMNNEKLMQALRHSSNISHNLKQVRSISFREAASVQSFPDDYLFECGSTAEFKQIGNAVPLLMTKRIAATLKS